MTSLTWHVPSSPTVMTVLLVLALAVLDGMVRTLAGGLVLGLWLLKGALMVLEEAQAQWVPAPVVIKGGDDR